MQKYAFPSLTFFLQRYNSKVFSFSFCWCFCVTRTSKKWLYTIVVEDPRFAAAPAESRQLEENPETHLTGLHLCFSDGKNRGVVSCFS